MPLTCIVVIDRSGMFGDKRAAVLDGIVRAVQTQVERDFCPAWGRAPIPVLLIADGKPVPEGAGLVYLVDRLADAKGAVGFHKADSRGFFSGAVAVEAIARLGGTMTSGGDSVSSALSHEVLEVLQNPGVNYWVEATDGKLLAMEVCDPVSADSYSIEVEPQSGNDTSRVSVSNFVYPDWFHPFAPSGSRYDHMGLLSKPFETRIGGYVSVRDHQGVGPMFGDSVPAAKRERVATAGRCVRACKALAEESVVGSVSNTDLREV